MKDTAQPKSERFDPPLVSRSRVLGYSVWSNIRTLRSPRRYEFDPNRNQGCHCRRECVCFGRSRAEEKLAQEKLYLENEIRSEMNFAQIVGKSAQLRRVLKQVETSLRQTRLCSFMEILVQEKN